MSVFNFSENIGGECVISLSGSSKSCKKCSPHNFQLVGTVLLCLVGHSTAEDPISVRGLNVKVSGGMADDTKNTVEKQRDVLKHCFVCSRVVFLCGDWESNKKKSFAPTLKRSSRTRKAPERLGKRAVLEDSSGNEDGEDNEEEEYAQRSRRKVKSESRALQALKQRVLDGGSSSKCVSYYTAASASAQQILWLITAFLFLCCPVYFEGQVMGSLMTTAPRTGRLHCVATSSPLLKILSCQK